jgi:Family of unknown function (DUF6404)
LLATTASLTFLLKLVVWVLGPNQPASAMEPALASTLLIRVAQALYFVCMDLASLAIVFLILSYAETPPHVRYASPYRCTSPNVIHREKVERMVRELEAKGLDRSMIAPGTFRLLWTLGVPIPPPLFLGFFPLMLIFGVSFALGLAALCWLVNLGAAFWITAIGGIAFGSVMSAYFARKAGTLQLPAWKDYGLD